ncbi:MAG: six-hairpin glycosidase-like protein [Bacteroidales bacterium]
MKKIQFFFLLIFISNSNLFCQENKPNFQDEIFWKVGNTESIVWDLTSENRLPHGDNIEMSGQQVAGIIHYTVDENKYLSLNRHLIFPQLRVYINSTESEWLKYRAYLKHDYEDEFLPVITFNHRTFEPGQIDSVKINGMLTFYHAERYGLSVERSLYPSMTERLFVEKWKISNNNDSICILNIGKIYFESNQSGIYGNYKRVVFSDADEKVIINPGEDYEFAIYFSAYLNNEPKITTNFNKVLKIRLEFLDTIKQNLVLKTPDPILNTLFYFSKIRAAESIYKTTMGLVHSPGGGRYYTGVWANDQAEYSGPFFPYLGMETGNAAALNAYRVFLKNIPENDGHFWSSFEMNGELTCCGGDRGDAAMIAFGAAHYVMATGNKNIALELWPLIEWSLDYCERQKNEFGVINSDTDEMEGRIPTGDANLSTSALYYGALRLAVDLGKAIQIPKEQINKYEKNAKALKLSIEAYFGATINGLETYRYFDGHEYLRHWICLPLVMGINDRKEGTLDALFFKLWTNNGVRVEENLTLEEPDLFWDRGTLYAFRGAFKAGATERSIEKLTSYSQTRLMGFHVPYVVEAWPEGNMAHLSAESALYCRIFTEGLLGINPTGLNRFEISPYLPEEWETYSLTNIQAFQRSFDVTIARIKDKIEVKISEGEKVVFSKSSKQGQTIQVKF